VTALLTIFESGLNLGAMYAAAAIALALLWGALGMLNMAQGALLAVGGYASYAVVEYLGFPWWLGLPAAMVVGAVIGGILYYATVKWMYDSPSFDTSIVIATVGVAIIIENLLLKFFTAYAKKQPFLVDHGILMGTVTMRYQTLINIAIAVVLMAFVAWLLNKTRMGTAIRAVSQNRDAAQLMGVSVRKVFFQTMVIAGAVAGGSGVLLTSVIPMSPYVGHDPLLKAFIICIVAGLGNIPAAFCAAFVLAWFEASISYAFGTRFGFPSMLILVIFVLLWRPYGLFGRGGVTRV
jgi:branched-chain amino acid transport system permease protein